MPDAQPEPTSSPRRPWWVRIAVLGYTSKVGVRLATWICLLGALGFGIYGIVSRKMIPASAGFLLSLLGAWWHDRAISWIDRNGGWPKK